jgi:hypothetical protein
MRVPSTFLSSYLHEVTSNLSNWHTNNYDFYRFGPHPRRPWKTVISDILRRGGCLGNDDYSDGMMAAVRLVEADLARFEWLYNQLADDESREILVGVLAFRALGHRRVKLPLNTPAYWDKMKQLERLANPSDFITISFLNWQLHRMDLNAIGVPVQLYFTPLGVYHQFVLEQYRCRSRIADIAVEEGDYVIDAGGCWGDTALYFAHRSRPDGRVFSYEFVPGNLLILQRNLKLNPDLGDRIQIIERAAWGIGTKRRPRK